MQSYYVALPVTLAGAFYAYKTLQQVVTKWRFRHGQLALGTVLHWVRQGDEDSSTYWFEVQFTTAAQVLVTAQQTLTSFTLRLQEGQTIQLLYNPREPQQFQLTTAAMDRNIWVYGALAAVCFGAAWFVFLWKDIDSLVFLFGPFE